MKWFLYAISIFFIAIGCCTILYTNESRKFVRSLFNEIDRKIISAFEALMGILILLSASSSHHSWFIRSIGLLAVIEGVVILLIPKDWYDQYIDWYVNSLSDQTYRLSGIFSIILGTAVLSWIL